MDEIRQHTVYISGPMTGLPEFNYPAFHAKQEELEDRGHNVVNPARTGEIDTAHLSSPQWLDYMISALQRMRTCTAIIMLEGWEESPGARIEREVALRKGLIFLSTR